MNVFTNEEKYKIIDMYKSGINIDDIIRCFNAQEKDVRFVLKNNSVDRSYNYFSDELYQRIISLYQNGYTQRKICDMLLIGEPVIRKTLKRNGIKMRTYSECNRQYKINEHYFDKIDTSRKAYILGLLYADGCNHESHYSITIALQEEDKHVLEFIKNELEYEGPLRFNDLSKKNLKHKNQYILCINNKYMSQQLSKLGVVNAKSLVLTFPNFIKDEFLPSFVMGYFDGDGCINYDEKRQKCYTKTAGTKEFCDGLSIILDSFGCKHHIVHPKQCQNSNTYVLQTGGNKSSLSFLSWMYDNTEFYMLRKYQKFLYFKEKYFYKMIA